MPTRRAFLGAAALLPLAVCTDQPTPPPSPAQPTTTTAPARGDVLAADKRAFLRDLLERNATRAGAMRVRAGVPKGWPVADKTGTGGYGTIVDVGVVWPPSGAPVVVSVMSSKAAEDAEYDQAILAEAAAYVVETLT